MNKVVFTNKWGLLGFFPEQITKRILVFREYLGVAIILFIIALFGETMGMRDNYVSIIRYMCAFSFFFCSGIVLIDMWKDRVTSKEFNATSLIVLLLCVGLGVYSLLF